MKKSQAQNDKKSGGDLADLGGPLEPDLDTADIFAREMGRWRVARPPYTPYAVADSMGLPPMVSRLLGAKKGAWEVADGPENLPPIYRANRFTHREVYALPGEADPGRRPGGRVVGLWRIGEPS